MCPSLWSLGTYRKGAEILQKSQWMEDSRITQPKKHLSRDQMGSQRLKQQEWVLPVTT